MTITVRVLGPVAIDGSRHNGELSPKLRMLLALLVAQRGSVVSIDRLCDALWGDDQPASAGATLQSHLSRLRRLIEPTGRLVGVDRGYRLELPDGALDVDHFTRSAQLSAATTIAADAVRHAEAALVWWRGPAFGNLRDTEWIRPEAVRLDELRLTVVESWFESRLAADGDASLIGDLEGHAATHPLRERFVHW